MAPPPPLGVVLFGTLVSVFQNVALLQNCSETSAPPLCPLSPPVVIPECLLALLPMAGVETNEKQCSNLHALAFKDVCVCLSLSIYVCACVRVHVCISLLLCNDTVTADPGHSAIMADEQGSPGSGWSGWLLGGETLPRASAIIYPKSAASRHVAPDRELQYFICLPVNQPCVGADGNIV